MYDVIAQIIGYIWGLWRYRWAGMVLAWVLAIAGWGFVWQMPESYKATARLHVDSTSVLRPLLRGLAIQPDVNRRVEMMSRTLLTRPNLEKLMRMSDLDLTVKNEAQKEKVLNKLRDNISLAGDRQNKSLYSITYKHPNRETAKRVVQSLITIFIESTLGEKRKDSSGAQAFLDQQIAEYELRLSEAEVRLANFKQRNVGLLPGEAGTYYQRLGQANNELKQAKLQLSELENRRDELQRQLKGEEPVFFSSTFSSAQSLSPIDRRIQLLREQLDRLSVNYTEQHPEVKQIQNQIDALEEEKRAAFDMAREGNTTPAYSSLGNSPVYQNMRTMLAETEARIAELSVRVDEYANRVKALEDTVSTIPQVETELKQLDRDYTVIREQHANLLKRRESAMLSEQVERNADDIKFRVIDPPFVPLKPNEPNKLLLNAAVLVIALAAGAGLSLLISLLRPTFVDRRTLGTTLGLPVLGVVTMLPSPDASRRRLRQAIVFSSLAFCLVLVFAGVNISQSVL